ncbi:uncharacterized protein LOC126895208 [Daktulosphaira vitifoliae]|uniref:uncharacterized protein LOC126895208 n=1 Tax=Daktulosphaira vitifoliae TaxID=58002 RepID=UPI0021A97B27|nr:uncharacterized protein LOC126895208 [Daktulosphaira vitifoliae]
MMHFAILVITITISTISFVKTTYSTPLKEDLEKLKLYSQWEYIKYSPVETGNNCITFSQYVREAIEGESKTLISSAYWKCMELMCDRINRYVFLLTLYSHKAIKLGQTPSWVLEKTGVPLKMLLKVLKRLKLDKDNSKLNTVEILENLIKPEDKNKLYYDMNTMIQKFVFHFLDTYNIFKPNVLNYLFSNSKNLHTINIPEPFLKQVFPQFPQPNSEFYSIPQDYNEVINKLEEIVELVKTEYENEEVSETE